MFTRWDQIPKYPHIHYCVTAGWQYLDDSIQRYVDEYGLNLDPDFQRAHVWTESQQVSFVEYMLREPTSGQHLYFNHPGWMNSFEGDFVLVDGKQRLNAALRFLRGEIRAFDSLVTDFVEFKDGIPSGGRIPSGIEFYINIARLQTRRDVLQWYLDFNTGGTPHTVAEIERVRGLLEGEV